MAPKTSDGYVWTADAGLSKGGLECVGVIQPPQSPQTLLSIKYDVIVIGAGYAGLVAARDLTTTGHSVLLLEARDRIGGRTYTVSKDGFKYEMGGTWVTHHMQYLFREMTRYGMDRDLILTGDPDKAKGYYTINVPGAAPRKLPHDEAGRMTARAWDIFVNVDGAQCRNVCPLPHAQLGNVVVDRATVERWDRLSCRDRFDQIRHHLSSEETGLLESLLLHISGGHMETSSLWDMIRSHALLAYSSDNFNDIWLRYKLREGQSELAKRMFDEAVDTGLHYAFSSPVDAIEETPQKSPRGVVRVLTKNGKTYKAARVICTVPLHVLSDVKFTPLLSAKRREAIQLGHVNHMTKIHADVKNPELARWNGMRYPNSLMYGYGDGNLPNGNVHIVAFGKDERDTFVPERDTEKVVDALKKLHEMDVERLLFHNWSTDPYSKGGPAWWRPGYMTKYQDELQTRHGNVFFASADWAHGWRAAIDGALEQGTIAAHQCNTELRKLRKLISTSKL